MKRTLLIQFRKDTEALEHERRAFVQMGGYKDKELHSINLLNGDSVPKPNEATSYKSVISGGSPHRVLDPTRSKDLVKFYKALIKKEIPTLGICYANQAMAVSLGGKLDTKGNYAETGTIQLTLTKEGKRSMLFHDLPESFYAVVGHKIAVTKLPKGSTHLAYSKRCKFQAFRLGENFYGLQFHPELDKMDLVWRLKKYPEYLNSKTLTQVSKGFKKTPYTAKIIENFRQLEKI